MYTYHETQNIKTIEKIRDTVAELPACLDAYFTSMHLTTAARTQLEYARELKLFFSYLRDKNPQVSKYELRDIPFAVLEQVTAMDIDEYLISSKVRTLANGKKVKNDAMALKRKLTALRSMYGYYHRMRLIDTNPAEQANMPRVEEKSIVYLNEEQVEKLVENATTQECLPALSKARREKYKERDKAIIMTLLSTGIRVSECVGLDIGDVNFVDCSLRVVRKGGNEEFVYFSDECKEALKEYFDVRKQIPTKDEDERALFLSNQCRRISVRSIEYLVKHYTAGISSAKITPHKLRSTFGTRLYEETGDIYVVSETLGHKSVETSRKHYVKASEERKKAVRNLVRLSKESKERSNENE